MSSAPGALTQRLFFALWPSAAERRELRLAVTGALHVSSGRAVPEENLHLTLAFLGNALQSRLPELAQIGRHCAAMLTPSAPIVVRLHRLEHWARPKILVATATSEPQAALWLARALTDATAAAGFTPDLKPFRAHVTVARKVDRPVSLPLPHEIEWRCDCFALIDSRNGPSGPVYSVVESHVLVMAEKPQK